MESRRSREEYLDDLVREARTLASELLNDDGLFLDSVRRLSAIRSEHPNFENNPAFVLFSVINSESDHIPIASARSNCAAEWLAQCDAEEKELRSFYGDQVARACREIMGVGAPGAAAE